MSAIEEDNIEPCITLNNGVSMPRVGLGTHRLTPITLQQAVPAALDAGCRLFDTAASYRNEHALGEVLLQELSKRGMSREEVFVTSKLRPADQGYASALHALQKSAAHFGGYVDLYLIHWPGTSKTSPSDDKNRLRRIETWKALQNAYDYSQFITAYQKNKQCQIENSSNENEALQNEVEDLNYLKELFGGAPCVRAIGVSNFFVNHLKSLFKDTSFRIYPQVNQCEIHPMYHLKELHDFCSGYGIHLQAYSSFGSGKLFQREFLNIHPEVLTIAQRRIGQLSCMDETDDSKLLSCLAGVYLRWALQWGYSVIPKSSDPNRIHNNFAMCKCARLSQEEMDTINDIASTAGNKKVCWDASAIS